MQFFTDDSDRMSSMRLAFLAWAIGARVVWIKLSWEQGKMATVDENVIWIFGILMGGKYFQKTQEVKEVLQTNAQPAPETDETNIASLEQSLAEMRALLTANVAANSNSTNVTDASRRLANQE